MFAINVLAIGAHFDDIELGCGGALCGHIKKGDNVTMYVATDSGFTGDAGSRDAETARCEGEVAAKLIGADLVTGGHRTLFLEFCDEVNLQLVNLIRDRKIDTIYTHWAHDVHHDHAALALSTLHAARHVPRLLMYRSNWYQGAISFHKQFYVDITSTWHTKKEALCAYISEMQRTEGKWLDYFFWEAQVCGMESGVELAEAFQAVKWLA